MRSFKIKNEAATKPNILLVDDESFNLEILEELLNDDGYQTDTATNGREACNMLSENPDKYSVVLLDRMMPEMSGTEVTAYMKQDPQLRKIPIVMQSAKAAKQDIEDGLNSGILYYMTKPFAKTELLLTVATAVNYFQDFQGLIASFTYKQKYLDLPGSEEFSSVEEARNLAISLAQLADDPEEIVMGLYELMVNGIEHGNLGIGYQLKSSLQNRSAWLVEIKRRMELPDNKTKTARVDYFNEKDELVFKITDQGNGFNYRDFFEISTLRSLNSCGRGIAVARFLCFDRVEYVSPGNQVIVAVRTNRGI